MASIVFLAWLVGLLGLLPLSAADGFAINIPTSGGILLAGSLQFQVINLNVNETYTAFLKDQNGNYLNQRSFVATESSYNGYLPIPYFITNGTAYDFGVTDSHYTPQVETVPLVGDQWSEIVSPSPDYDSLQSNQSIVFSFLGTGVANMGSDADPYISGTYTVSTDGPIPIILHLDQNSSRYAANSSYFLSGNSQDFVLLTFAIGAGNTSTAWDQYPRPPISAGRIPRSLLTV